ncbi:hypothetical protein BDR07DRAFT_1436167, partial [Suillus spraguei]
MFEHQATGLTTQHRHSFGFQKYLIISLISLAVLNLLMSSGFSCNSQLLFETVEWIFIYLS